MTEDTDAVAVVVSEETGLISFVQAGHIKRGLDATRLRAAIFQALEVAPRKEKKREAETETVDAVVLDLMMPRLDGRSVKRGFNANASMRNVPVILVTGHVAPELDPDEFSCVLHKPVSVEALVKAVRSCLEKVGYP